VKATTQAERRATGIRDLKMGGLLLIALALALASLHSLLGSVGWWFAAFGIMLVVVGAAGVARYLLRARWVGTVAGLVVGIIAVTLTFGADTAFVGLIPTAGTFGRVSDLSSAAADSIARQAIPADATPGILFLVCSAIAAIALLMDAVAIWWRVPALAGIPLLIVIAVPSFVESNLADPFFFELTAVAYLFIIRNRMRRIQPGVALAVGAIAVLGALVIPVALPPVIPGGSNGTGPAVLVENINPIINLGDDLRRQAPVSALSYTTNSDTGQYLRLTTLENFAGKEWAPADPRRLPRNRVSSIGAAPGLTSAIETAKVKTTITVGNTSGRWLPVPYPPTSITGLVGQWSWEPEALAVSTVSSNMQGQKYAVRSLTVEPSQQQLEAAPRSPNSPLAVVPKGLDPIVAATAKKVVGLAATDFDKALALQDWFRGGTFTYSLHTPALSGFDGSGLDVIVPFLQSKSGYCVHFATAMAVMARTLGIPSRIAVGFLPGKETHPEGPQTTVYEVTSNDLHSWPELYFKGVGWVRFEPTPSKGFEPNFPDAPSSVPTAGSTDAPSSVATSTPTPGPNNQSRLPDESQHTSSGVLDNPAVPTSDWVLIAILALLLLLIGPSIIRVRIRKRRIDAIREGVSSAETSWQELRETARDLGIDAHSSATPRELSAQLASYLSAGLASRHDLAAVSIAALTELRTMVEDASFTNRSHPFVGESMAESLGVVLRGLRRATGSGARFRATFLPATLLDWALGRGVVRA
jgi:transglutaminase-like putative cysteine protease